ncbi:DNA ligase [Acrasis kona]|uniref:DNA ligase n=1 Tax=Acrasis kona TaxID=1008807 RepID=A0AAW2YI38_9EUKA
MNLSEDIAFWRTLDAFTYHDIIELQRLKLQISSPDLKLLIERDISRARTRMVNRLLNKNDENSRKTKVVEVETLVDDEDEYIDKYKKSIKHVQEALPHITNDLVVDAVIRCSGREEAAIEGLLGGEMPARPAMKKKTVKVTKKIIESSRELHTTLDLHDVSQSRNQLLTKAIDREQTVLNELIEESSRLSKVIDENRILVKSNVNIDQDSSQGNNKIYIRGEQEAIERNEFRQFTFRPERTFSNNASHIHFRVAESQLYRFIKTSSVVNEVKYIVSPNLIRNFELKRYEVAHFYGKHVKSVKPYLMYASVDVDENNIKWICENNVRAAHNRPVTFSYDPAFISEDIEKKKNKGRMIMCLVLCPGDEIKSGCCKVYDSKCVLPFYIVSYSKIVQVGAPVKEGIDEDWRNVEKNAKADKFMDDCMKFYVHTLANRDPNQSIHYADILYKEEEVVADDVGSDFEFVVDEDEDLEESEVIDVDGYESDQISVEEISDDE